MTRQKWNSKKDKSHNEISELMEQAGFVVIHTHHVGEGFPDQIATTMNGLTVVGTFDREQMKKAISEAMGVQGRCMIWPGAWLPVEVKEPDGQLTDDQKIFHAIHPVMIIDDPEKLREKLVDFLA